MPVGQAELIERLRALLASEPSVREVAIFGGRAFMVDDAIVVSTLKHGDLLVRIASEQQPDLLGRPGAARATMGTGRAMGQNWMSVAALAIESDAALESWVTLALDHNKSRSGPSPRSLTANPSEPFEESVRTGRAASPCRQSPIA